MEELLITSRENEKARWVKKIADKKFRDEYGQFLVENLTIIHDAMKSGVKPEMLFVREDLMQKGSDKLNYIIANCGLEEIYVINDRVNDYFTQLESGSGVAGVFSKFSEGLDYCDKIVYLDAINDPGNLGTILRSGVAFGLTNFVFGEGCAELYNPKTVQAAKDAIFKIKFNRDKDLAIFGEIKKKMPVMVARANQAEDLGKMKMPTDFCLVLGSETHGVNAKIEEQASKFVRIEMTKDMESLNVAASAAIIFHYIFINSL